VSDSWRDGFWEPFVHRELRARGYDVVTEQQPVVTVAPGQSLGRLARQRFEHGRNHARLEATTGSRATDVARIIGAPLVPFVLVSRSAREVWSRRRLRARLLLCVPVLLWVHGCWAFGEALGYLDHARERP